MIYRHQWTTEWFRQQSYLAISRLFIFNETSLHENKTHAKISELTVHNAYIWSSMIHKLVKIRSGVFSTSFADGKI